MKNSGRKEQKNPIVTSCQYLLRSSWVTPTNLSLMIEPVHPRNVPLKFEMPARSAKQVASMFLGVILAKRTAVGRKTNAMLSVSYTTSVKMITNMSDIPYYSFSRNTNRNEKGAKIRPTRASIRTSVRNS